MNVPVGRLVPVNAGVYIAVRDGKVIERVVVPPPGGAREAKGMMQHLLDDGAILYVKVGGQSPDNDGC